MNLARRPRVQSEGLIIDRPSGENDKVVERVTMSARQRRADLDTDLSGIMREIADLIVRMTQP